MSRSILLAIAMLGAVLGALSCSRAKSDAATPGNHEAAPPLAWHDWGVDAFEKARRENKIVVVDVGIEGCTACRWMYEITYADPAVRARLADSFIAIQVDADARPDVGLRYYPWGWPATIFLTPDGKQVGAVRGNKLPRNFIPILDEMIQRHGDGTLEELAQTPPTVATVAPQGELGDQCADAIARLDRAADLEYGGWGFEGYKQVRGRPIDHAFMRARARGEPWRRELALKSTVAFKKIMDPVWGGLFNAALWRDWTKIVPEKRTKYQTMLIVAAASAYRETGDRAFLEQAAEARRYLEDWLKAEDGTFFATQEDDATNLPKGMTALDYYELGDAERRKYGIPPLDHAIYTDINGRALRAYALLYEATGDTTALTTAIEAAEVLLPARQSDEGWMLQAAPSPLVDTDDRMRKYVLEQRVYLRPQAYFGRGLMSLLKVTGEQRWLDAATRIARGAQQQLEDPAGGFWAASVDGTEAILPRIKSSEDNAVMAQFLVELATVTQDEELDKVARRTLQYLGQPAVLADAGAFTLGEMALAFEMATAGPVEFSVVGEPADAAAAALFRAAVRVYEPRKVVHFDRTGRYPDKPEASLYICTSSVCSRPITDPKAVAGEAKSFARASDESPCGTIPNVKSRWDGRKIEWP